MMARKFSFSLLELVVIVLTGMMLAALAVPSLCRAQEKARLVSCIGNLDTCAKAAAMYAEANQQQVYLKCYDYPQNQILYSMINGAPMVTNAHKFQNTTAKYLQGYADACCPDVINPLNPLPEKEADALKFTAFYAVPYMAFKQGTKDFCSELMRNYVDVRNIHAYDNPRANNIAAISLTLSKLTLPAEAILFAEAWRNNSNGNEAYWHYSFSGSSRIQMRHDGKSNMAFADGHVAALGVDAFKPLAAAGYISRDTKFWDELAENTLSAK